MAFRSLQSPLWNRTPANVSNREAELASTRKILQRVLYFLDERPRNSYNMLHTYDAIFEKPALSKRHDVYDNSLAAMFYLMMGRSASARLILEGMLKAGGTVDFGEDDEPVTDKDVRGSSLTRCDSRG